MVVFWGMMSENFVADSGLRNFRNIAIQEELEAVLITCSDAFMK